MSSPDGPTGHGSPATGEVGDLETGVALGVVRTLDRWYVELQDVARSLGLLGSGRESVRETEDETGAKAVEFPDLADEGWPGFALAIPRDGVFSHVTSSVFYRGVQYTSELGPQELLVAFKGALSEVGAEYEARDDHLDDYLRTTALGGDVRIRVGPHEDGRTRISVGQYRSARRVETALRSISRRFSFGGGDEE